VDAMQISGPRNHMGVVQFNSVPTVLSPIVFDTAALHSAVNGYTTSANTRITPALVMADTMLQASVRPLAPKVIVLMSDGLPDAGDKAIFVQAEAGVLSSEGIRVYTVYIGDDGGLGALAFMNSLKGNGGKSANAVNPGDLDGIMADISNIEGCN
jgi:Mg-chelatase subunit ChlD